MQQGNEYDRMRAEKNAAFTYIGSGEPGGKASGLAFIKDTLDSRFPQNRFQSMAVTIPTMTVLLTDVFDSFMSLNNLYEVAYSDLPDERIAHEFQKADLPSTIVGDLLSLISAIHTPLAVRSSSLLEDAVHAPFAGVYETKMIPNNQFNAAARFQKLVEAVKFVYASTYFKNARDYCRAIGKSIRDEKMAVIIQEVVGRRHGDRFYPAISGVVRSYNFYPVGSAPREEGVVNLALGLGKTIVEGGRTWMYSPRYPQIPPPYNSINDLLKQTQTDFWAVNMGPPPEYDPVKETEYLLSCFLRDAEKDGILRFLCSSYDMDSDRLSMGIAGRAPRLVDFSPVLQGECIPLNALIEELLLLAEEKTGGRVEIEFALTLDPSFKEQPRLGFLQVRPMAVSDQCVTINKQSIPADDLIVFSKNVLGNCSFEDVRDIVYVKPDVFTPADTLQMAAEIEAINRELSKAGRSYVLIGFGRWGSSDPWLGIPVAWSQISGARVIVEGTLPEMNPDLSQGSHFFHNITSLGIPYFSIDGAQAGTINWNWLNKQPAESELQYIRHVRRPSGLHIKVNGKTGCGVVIK